MATFRPARDPLRRPAGDRAGPTRLETVRSWVEMAGVVAAIIGIVILVVQTNELSRQNAVIIESLDQTYRQDAFDKSLGFDEFVVEHAQLYAMVTAGAADQLAADLREGAADAAIIAQADAVAVHILDFYDYVLLGYPTATYPQLGRVDRSRPGYDAAEADGFLAWSNAVRDTFRRGSYLCAVYQAKKDSYGTASFVNRIDGARLC